MLLVPTLDKHLLFPRYFPSLSVKPKGIELEIGKFIFSSYLKPLRNIRIAL